MNIKEAFDKLAKSTTKCMKNPFFIIRALNNDFKDIAENIDGGGGGSEVKVIPAQDSGFLVGNIQIDGEDNYLFAPPQVPQPDIYSDTEHKVGIWYHDNIAEDVWEKTYIKSNISFTDHYCLIDANFHPTDYIILETRGSVYTANGSMASLSGIPGITSWEYGIHNNANGLLLYSITDASDIVGGTCYCTLRYVKKT